MTIDQEEKIKTEIVSAVPPKKDAPAAIRPAAPVFRTVKDLSESDITLFEIRRILGKRRWIILKVTLAVFVLVLTFTLAQTPKFRSESTIEFSEDNSASFGLDESRQAQGDPTATDYALLQRTQVKALLSDTLALRLISQLALEEPPAAPQNRFLAALARHKKIDESGLPLERAPHRRVQALKAFHQDLNVTAVPGTRMISIQYLSPNPQTAALVVNTLVADYKEQYFQNRYSATVDASGWLSKQLEDLRTEVQSSQQKLVDYQQQAGILGTDESHNIVMMRLEEGAKELMNAQQGRILAETVAQLVRKGDPDAVSDLMGAVAGSISSQSNNNAPSASPYLASPMQNLRAREIETRMDYAEASARYGSANPKLIELKSKMDEVDQLIQQELEKMRLRAENDYIAALRKENALRQAFENEKNEANQLSDSAIQYTLLKQEVDSNRTLYEGLLKKFKESTVLAGLRGSNILVVDPALVPDRPAQPIVPLNLSLGLLIGLCCGVATAFAAERLDDTVGTGDEAEDIAAVRLLGTVANWTRPGLKRASLKSPAPSVYESGICVVHHSRSQPADCFRAIRAAIIQSSRPGISTPILIASAATGEGRSTVSLNCAAAFAQHGSRVLLVEADLRRPRLNSYLGLKRSTGLSSMLQGDSCPDLPCILPSLPNLSIIPAGPLAQSPTDLLDSARMKELVTLWRGQYDYMFFDTPPALSVTDAAVLAPACDLVVLVARAGLTRRQALLRVSKLFARLRPRVLGVVLNALDITGSDFDAQYNYGSERKEANRFTPSGPNGHDR